MVNSGNAVYIMTNKPRGVIYVGVSSNLIQRIYKHRTKYYPFSFTAKYNLTKVVFYEHHENIEYAIQREKQLKKWRRSWKIALIETQNPDWLDLWCNMIS